MNKSIEWDHASVPSQARRLAEEAARRAGVSLEKWIDEAIARRAAGDISGENSDELRSPTCERVGRAWLDEAEDYLGTAVTRIERRVRRSEDRMARAIETMAGVFERSRESLGGAALSRVNRLPDAPHEQQPATSHRHLDERMEEIARLIEAARGMAHARSASLDGNLERRRLDLQTAVPNIALRRQELEAGEAYRVFSGPEPAQETVDAHSTGTEQSFAEHDGGAAGADVGEPHDSVSEAISSPPPEAPEEAACAPAALPDPAGREGDQRHCLGLTAIREGIAAMTLSLAELAPRNAVIALEGAVRDLTERIALLRQDGQQESLLAPLVAMAAELRASLKAHDPHAAVAGLEREISALAGKVDGLAVTAISPEAFARIERQTEEVRNLLAAAATRSMPIERLERQIGELADRIEQLGSSQALQVESEQMTALLAALRGEIERSTPLSALTSIESRLEHIAARVDQEIGQPAQKSLDSLALEGLARQIDGVRQSLEARVQPQIDTFALEASLKELSAKLESPSSEPLAALMRDINAKLDAAAHKDADAKPDAVEPMLAEIIDKLGRLPQPDAGPDLRSIESLLQSLDAKLDSGAGPALGRDIVGEIAQEVARRLEKEFVLGASAQGLAEQFAYVHERLEALSDLGGMQGLMQRLSVQLAGLAREPSSANKEETPSLAAPGNQTGAVVRGIEALGAMESSPSGGPRRSFTPAQPADEVDTALSQSVDDDVLLEPGAGAPHRVRDALEPALDTRSRTNSSISAHIAAARRAATSAVSEVAGQNASVPATSGARGLERAKSLYANHKRSVLFVAAFAIAALAAVQLIVAHAPVAPKSQLSEQSAKTAAAGGLFEKSGAPVFAGAPTAPRVDTTPTASIGSASEAPKVDAPNGTAGPQLSPTVAALLPTSLRDAVVAGSPAAEYELAERLYEGRGAPQDHEAAALWFERAASSGLAPAQFRLATLYVKGAGVQRDAAAAKRWYAKAAEAGNVRAAHNLAVLYAEPAGEAPDYVEAAKWFRKAAEWGVRDSQFNLAILTARGLGVDRDFRQSWVWFSLAAAQGDADAARKRDEVAAKMDAGALAAAADTLTKFKAAKPDPAANEVPPPPGGWDGKPGVFPPSPAPASSGGTSTGVP